ncbi:hypothetical protein [Streptomyces sp. NPDC127197]
MSLIASVGADRPGRMRAGTAMRTEGVAEQLWLRSVAEVRAEDPR